MNLCIYKCRASMLYYVKILYSPFYFLVQLHNFAHVNKHVNKVELSIRYNCVL